MRGIISIAMVLFSLSACTPARMPESINVAASVLHAAAVIELRSLEEEYAGNAAAIKKIKQVAELVKLYDAWKRGEEPQSIALAALHEAIDIIALIREEYD